MCTKNLKHYVACLLALILTTIAPFQANAQTYVGGNQWGTWTRAGSPYVVTGVFGVTVPSGQVLTIEPGVVVQFRSVNHYLNVNGTLNAVGTIGDSIVFTSNKSIKSGGQWKGIQFSNGQGTLEYCVVEAAGDSTDMRRFGLAISSSTVSLSHSVVRKISNRFYHASLVSDGITITNGSSAVLTNCRVEQIEGLGIVVNTNAIITMSGCEIEDNGQYGLSISTSASSIGTSSVRANSIHDNRGYGIAVTSTGKFPEISDNIILNNGSANYAFSGLLDHDMIWDNSIRLNGVFTVSAGNTLTILPGVTTEADNYHIYLIIQGTLNAIGTTTDSIRFTSSAATKSGGQWGGIYVSGGRGTLDYCIIEAAGSQDDAKDRYGLHAGSSAVLSMSHSVVRKIANTYPYGANRISHGIWITENASATLTNLLVENAEGDGIRVDSNAVAAVTASEIRNNGDDGFELSTNNNSVGVSSVTGNNIHDNGFYGIRVISNGKFPTISDNIFTGNGGGELELGVSGLIDRDMTWNHEVKIDLINATTLTSGHTLSFLPGMAVGGYGKLIIEGLLNAVGTATDSIFWQGRTIEFSNGQGTMAYCVVTGVHEAILAARSSIVSVTHSVFRENTTGLVVSDSSTVELSELLLENGSAGIEVRDFAVARVIGCEIRNNYTGLYFSTNDNSVGVSSITGNNIHNNGNGISVRSDGKFPTISDNLFAMNGSADLELSGRIDQDMTWNMAVDMLDTVTVTSGHTLNISPGVVVNGMDWGVLNIHGVLNAIGTVADSVRFTTDDGSYGRRWKGISFSNGRGTLEYCIVEYAGRNDNQTGFALLAEQSSLLNLDHSVVRQIGGAEGDSAAYGLWIKDASTATLTDVLLDEVLTDAIRVGQGATVTVTDCKIYFSGANGIFTSGASTMIRRSQIINNRSGIYIGNGTPNLGTITDPGHNAIYGNSEWQIYNATANNVYAQNNLWLVPDSATIDAGIFDDDEENGNGKIIFTPWIDHNPFSTNLPPWAQAGADQFVHRNQIVTLDASASIDPEGDPLTFIWTQIEGWPPVDLSNPNSSICTFQTPQDTNNYTIRWQFRLQVSDGQLSSTDDILIFITDPPVANAGPDQTVQPGTLVTLFGEGSHDPNGDPLTFKWTQIVGPKVSLDDSTVWMPTFIAPWLGGEQLTFQLQVSDGALSDMDTVMVTVNTENEPPIANAGPDQSERQGYRVILDGGESYDPDGSYLIYRWIQIAGPRVTLEDSTNWKATFIAPAQVGAQLVFQLQVSDGALFDKDTVTVTIMANLPPVANAGPDQYVPPGAQVTLDGSDSHDRDDSYLIYSWTQIAGPRVTFDDTTIVHPTFTAPSTGGVRLTFQLQVSDGNLSAMDTVMVNVGVNFPPVAHAGADTTVDELQQVTLNGSQSSDPDGDTLTFLWSQIAGPNVTLNDTAAAVVTFTSPRVFVNTVLSFRVAVGDSEFTASDTVNVTVRNSINEPPVANAGPDQNVRTGNQVTLNGTGSSDPNGEPLTFDWNQIEGPAVSLSDTAVASPTFAAPEVAASTSLRFVLVVSDGQTSAHDTVNTTVTANQPPIANAGPDQTVGLHSMVQLNGSGSSDPNGDPLTFLWTESAANPATNLLSNAQVATSTFTPPLSGIYTFALVVNDGRLNSAPDSVTITVLTNQAPILAPISNVDVLMQDTLTVSISATDPEHDPITLTVSNLPALANFTDNDNGTGRLFLSPQVSDRGSYPNVIFTASDGVLAVHDTITIRVVGHPPIAHAGADITVDELQPVTLDGSSSNDADGDALTFVWSQITGPKAALSDTAATIVTSTAPRVYVDTVLRFRLAVRDNEFTRADTVNVTVRNTINELPVANAGLNQFVEQGNLVTLDGSKSYDPNGDTLTFLWRQVEATAITQITLVDTTSAKITFTAPELTLSNSISLRFELFVNDGKESAHTRVEVSVSRPSNKAPIANAGPDQTVDMNTLVQLDGTGSTDQEGDTLTYFWTETSSNPQAGLLSSRTAPKPALTPTVPGTYSFFLVVNDGNNDSSPDQVIVTVNFVRTQPEPAISASIPAGMSNPAGVINTNTQNSVSVLVNLPTTSLPTDVVQVILSDGMHQATGAGQGSTGSGTVQITGIDASALSDGPVSIQVVVSDSVNTASASFAGASKNTQARPPVVSGATSPTIAPEEVWTISAEAGSWLEITGGASAITKQLKSGQTETMVLVGYKLNEDNLITVTATNPAGNKASTIVLVTQFSPTDILVAQLNSRELTTAEVEKLVEQGILDLADPSNFTVQEFKVTLRLGGGTSVEGEIDFAFSSGGGASDDKGVWRPGDGQQQVFEPPEVVPVILRAPGAPPIPGIIVIEGDIKVLKEFFSVQLILFNQSQAFNVQNVKASIQSGPGLTLMVPQTGNTIEMGEIIHGNIGEANFIVRGDEKGTHTVTVNYSGEITGPGITTPLLASGLASTSLTVTGPPKLLLELCHPAAVTAGEIYTLNASVTNQSARAANFASIRVQVSQGAELVDPDKSVVDLGHIPPGAAATASWKVRALITGPITTCNVDTAAEDLSVSVAAGGVTCGTGSFPVAKCAAQTVTPPSVINITPRSNGVEVPISSAITAEFSERLASVNISVNDGRGDLAGTVAIDPSGYFATFTPTAALQYNTLHKVTISEAVDIDGEHQVGEFFSFFATETVKPRIVVSPAVLDFGINRGNGVKRALIVSNTGEGFLEVKRITTDNPEYAPSVTRLVVRPGEADTIDVTLDSAVEGNKSAQLLLQQNDPHQPQLTVGLTGFVANPLSIVPVTVFGPEPFGCFDGNAIPSQTALTKALSHTVASANPAARPTLALLKLNVDPENQNVTVADATPTPSGKNRNATIQSAVPINALVKFKFRNVEFDADQKINRFEIALQNISAQPIYTPIRTTLASFTTAPPRITVRNADGGGNGVGAFWEWNNFIGSDKILAAGELSEYRVWEFNNPDQIHFFVEIEVTGELEDCANRVVEQQFVVPNFAELGPEFNLIVINGKADDSGRLSSAEINIALNGTTLLGPNDFTQSDSSFSKTVTLAENNLLRVDMNTQPGRFVTLKIETKAKAPFQRFISLSPYNPLLNFGETVQFTATGINSDLSLVDLTATAVWESSNPSVASVSSSGLVTAESGGTSELHAKSEGFVSAPVLVRVNRPPVFTSSPILTGKERVEYAYQAKATDPDGDSLRYALTTAPTGMKMSEFTGLINWTPPLGQAGNHEIVIRAEDGKGSLANQSYTIVIKEEVNLPPHITSTPVTVAIMEQPYAYKAVAIDSNRDALVWSLKAAPQGMTIDTLRGLIQWIPSNMQVDTFDISIEVIDGRGGSDVQSIKLGVNIPTGWPVVRQIGPTISGEGDFVDIYGEGFSTNAAECLVMFNGTLATVLSSTSTKIETKVPVGAVSGAVTVSIHDRHSNGFPFQVNNAFKKRPLTQKDFKAGLVIGEVLLQYVEGELNPAKLEHFNRTYGFVAQQYFPRMKFYRAILTNPTEENTISVQSLLEADPAVAYAGFNSIEVPASIDRIIKPNEVYGFRYQHHLEELNIKSSGTDSLTEAYTSRFPKLGDGIKIGIIDSGIGGGGRSDLDVIFDKSFATDWWGNDSIKYIIGADTSSWWYLGESPADNDIADHGTAVATVAAGQIHNNWGGVGVAPKAKIVNLKVFDTYYVTDVNKRRIKDMDGNDSVKTVSAPLVSIFNALVWAFDEAGENKPDVINMSLGPEPCKSCSRTYQQRVRSRVEAYNHVFESGSIASLPVMVAAAGNEGDFGSFALDNGVINPAFSSDPLVSAPAGARHVIAVGALERSTENRAPFSNYGGTNSNSADRLDFVVEGVHINTTGTSGYENAGDGTSLAAPQVAGLAALILAEEPNLAPSAVELRLRELAIDIGPAVGWDRETGFGRLRIPGVSGLVNTSGGDANGSALPGNGGDVTVESGITTYEPPSIEYRHSDSLIVRGELHTEENPILWYKSITIYGTLIADRSVLLFADNGNVNIAASGRIISPGADNISIVAANDVIVDGLIDTHGSNGDGIPGGTVYIGMIKPNSLEIPTIITRGGDADETVQGGKGGAIEIMADNANIIFSGARKSQRTIDNHIFPIDSLPPPPPYNLRAAQHVRPKENERQPLDLIIPRQLGFLGGLLTSGGMGGSGTGFGETATNGGLGGDGGNIFIIADGDNAVIEFREIDIITGGDVETVVEDPFVIPTSPELDFELIPVSDWETMTTGFIIWPTIEHGWMKASLLAPTGSLGGKGAGGGASFKGGDGGKGGKAGDISVTGTLKPKPAMPKATVIYGLDRNANNTMIFYGDRDGRIPNGEGIGLAMTMKSEEGQILYRARVDINSVGPGKVSQALGGSGGFPGGSAVLRAGAAVGFFGYLGDPGNITGLPVTKRDIIALTKSGATTEHTDSTASSAAPQTFALQQNYPNPFNPQTTIRYQLPEASQVKIVVFNLLGQVVRTLVDETKMPGYYNVIWDGKNAAGHSVASGVYFYRMRAGKFIMVRKMMIVR